MAVPSGNESVLDGVLKDVFEALTHSLKYKFLLGAQADRVFGGLQPDGTYSGMLGALARKVWLSLMAAVVVCAAVSVLLCDVSLDGWRAESRGLLLSRYCWIFWSYLIGHDAGTPRRWTPMREMRLRQSFRVLLAAWLVGPVVNSLLSFQGSITSTFAVSRTTPVVSGLDELAGKGGIVPVVSRGSAVEICFKTSRDHAHLWNRMRNNTIQFSAANVEDTLTRAERGTHVLIVDYVYALGIAADWVKRTGRCTVQVEELPFCQSFIALALGKDFDSGMRRKIDSKLTYVLQAKLTDRWLNRVLKNYTHCTRLPASDGGVSRALTVADIAGGIVLWAAGVAVAVLSLLGERASGRVVRRREGVVARPSTVPPPLSASEL